MRNEWNKQGIPLFTPNFNHRQQKPDLSPACNSVQLQRADFFAPKSLTAILKVCLNEYSFLKLLVSAASFYVLLDLPSV